jgi:hypothetical protein
MGRILRRSLPVCAAVLAALLVFAGCSAAAAVDPAMKRAELAYLQAAKEDLAEVDSLFADKDIGLLADDSSSSEDVTSESLAKYADLLTSYDTRISDRLDALRTRTAPDNADIASCKAAEIDELEMVDSILKEYIQLMKYAGSILGILGDLGQMDEIAGLSDPEAIYNSFNATINKALETLKGVVVPSFLKSTNETLVTSLNEINDAVLYAMQSAAIDDPVRSDAAFYRIDIWSRGFSKFGDDFLQDILSREATVTGDLKGIQAKNTALESWIQGNIDKLSGTQEEAQ